MGCLPPSWILNSRKVSVNNFCEICKFYKEVCSLFVNRFIEMNKKNRCYFIFLWPIVYSTKMFVWFIVFFINVFNTFLFRERQPVWNELTFIKEGIRNILFFWFCSKNTNPEIFYFNFLKAYLKAICVCFIFKYHHLVLI